MIENPEKSSQIIEGILTVGGALLTIGTIAYFSLRRFFKNHAILPPHADSFADRSGSSDCGSRIGEITSTASPFVNRAKCNNCGIVVSVKKRP